MANPISQLIDFIALAAVARVRHLEEAYPEINAELAITTREKEHAGLLVQSRLSIRRSPAPSPRAAVDTLLEYSRGLEYHHASRRNWYLRPSLGITADALALAANHERAERRQLHGFATFKTISNFFEHQLYELCRTVRDRPTF